MNAIQLDTRDPITTHNVRTLRRFVADFVNGGDEGTLKDLVHQDYLYRSPSEEIRGHEALKAMFREYRRAFPDLRLSIESVLADGDRTTMSFRLRGTQQADFMGLPASGRAFDISGVVISTYRDGKIAEEWELLDQLSMLQQLGALPA